MKTYTLITLWTYLVQLHIVQDMKFIVKIVARLSRNVVVDIMMEYLGGLVSDGVTMRDLV